MYSFTRIDAIRMPNTSALLSIGSGLRSLPMEDPISSNPMTRIATDTRRPEIYSILPCPNGCSGSGSCPESRKPINVMIDDPASERLLNASAIIAIEPLIVPASHFQRTAKYSVRFLLPRLILRMPALPMVLYNFYCP